MKLSILVNSRQNPEKYPRYQASTYGGWVFMKIAFAFIDEVGIGFTPEQPFFGVGMFVIENLIPLNRKIHDIFTGAVSYFRKHRTRFEFKFNAVTSNNLRFYKEIVKTLTEDKSWSFSAILIKKDHEKWHSKDYWQIYLQILDKFINDTPADKVTLVADYLAKPKPLNIDFLNLKSKKRIANILQLESQGSLILQLTDILLGALHFEERRKLLKIQNSKVAKLKLVETVNAILEKGQKERRVRIQKMTAIEWLHAVNNTFTKKSL